MNTIFRKSILVTAACSALVFAGFTSAADWTMWGRTPSRNMVAEEKDPPTEWSVGEDAAKPGDGKNIKWEMQLGSQSYGNMVVAGGIVWVGSNNEAKYEPEFDKDGGSLLAFRESDGKFLWQRYSPKLAAGRVNDWPFQGICCSPYIEGDRLWYATSRCEIVCLNVSTLKHDTGGKPEELWKLDMMEKLGVFPHNMTSCSITAYKDFIYVITGNGVDDTHKNIPNPQAPAIICVNKNTGEVVWQDNAPGNGILHGQWASPALAEVNGVVQVIAPLGDGWIYSYEATTGKLIWKFDSNKKETIYPTTRNELIATPVIVDNKMYIANGQDPEHGEGIGHLWCVDITKTGDISLELPGEEVAQAKEKQAELLVPEGAATPRKGKPNPNSGVVWQYASHGKPDKRGRIKRSDRMNRTISTVSVYNGLVFAPDFSGFVHCLDAANGQHYWAHDMEAAMWGSPLAVDGKVYICDEDGDVAIFKAEKEESAAEPIATHNMGSAVYCSPVFANGTLYIMNRERLFAISDKK
jgi:outer membrane protein assembly factor BamB